MRRLGMGQVILLAVLIITLIFTTVWATSVWNASSEAVMDKHGWIALGLGTFFSLLIGCGLMALMFFSSRACAAKPPPHLKGMPPCSRNETPQQITVRRQQGPLHGEIPACGRLPK